MKVRDLVLISLLSASLTAGKMALSFIPNVEIVTLLFMVYTVTLGLKRTLAVAVIFATTEIFLYGFNTWVLAYYFVWPALILGTHLVSKKFTSEYTFAIVAAVFGASFGFLFAVFESFFYGVAYGIAYWIRGIPFDIIHGGSNYVIAIILYEPLVRLFTQQIQAYQLKEID